MKNLQKIVLASLMLLLLSCSGESHQSETGAGGSMARFAIKGNYLYTVDNQQLQVFNIQNPASMQLAKTKYLGFGIETIFPTQNHLFIGAMDGMYIFELESPEDPQLLSYTSHFVSYDPVVVHDGYAYVTLRNSGVAGSGVNVLLVFDISKLTAPQLLKEYEMESPRGIGIDNGTLFVCDNGLKVYRVTNGDNLELVKTFDIQAIDVIPMQGKLYVIAADGLYQYSYNGDEVGLISRLTLVAN